MGGPGKAGASAHSVGLAFSKDFGNTICVRAIRTAGLNFNWRSEESNG
jgi:hypothetical protein